MAEKYRSAFISEIQAALDGKATVDLYVHIPQADRYLIFLRKDQEVGPSKRDNLQRLAAGSLYVLETESTGDAASDGAQEPDTLGFLDPDSSFRNESLGSEANTILHDAYKRLLSEDEKSGANLAQQLVNMSDAMLSALAPETGDLKKSIIKNLANLNVMNDAAAIASLSLLVAIANEFTSRTAMRQLSQACVFMDVALGDIEQQHLELYYKDRKSVPTHIQDQIKIHPVRSQKVLEKYPEVSSTVGQMILLHHELHNGKGYHRGIRTSNVLPLARVLSFGVDLYEYIKKERLNGGKKTLKQIMLDFRELGLEPHMRRHATPLVDNVLKYLKILA